MADARFVITEGNATGIHDTRDHRHFRVESAEMAAELCMVLNSMQRDLLTFWEMLAYDDED